MKKLNMSTLAKRTLLFISISILGIFLLGYFSGYSIININSMLITEIEEDLQDSRITGNKKNIKILKKTKIDNQLFIYYTFELEHLGKYTKKHGIRQFERWLNLYHKDIGTYTTQSIIDDKLQYLSTNVSTKEGDYHIIFGKNTHNYSRVLYKINDVDYVKNISNSSYFFVSHRLPKDYDYDYIEDVKLVK